MSFTESELNYYKKNPSHITDELNTSLLVELIDFDAHYIQYIKNQNFELIQAAFERDPSIFKYIDMSKVSIQFLEKAISENPVLIQYVYSPSPEIMKLALSKDLNMMQFLYNSLDENMYLWLVTQNGMLLEFIQSGHQTENIVRTAIYDNIESYKYSSIKTKEFDMYIIEQDPSRIDLISEYWEELIEPLIRYNPRMIVKFFNKPNLLTNELKRLAIAGDPMIFTIIPGANEDLSLMKFTIDLDFKMMEHIEITPTILEYALSKYGKALKYVRKKDLRTIKNAIKLDVAALDYVEYPRQFLIDYAFSLNGWALKYIKSPTAEQCVDAVQRNPLAIEFVPAEFITKEIQLGALIGGAVTIPFIGKPIDEDVVLQVIGTDPSYIFSMDPDEINDSMYITAFGKSGRLILYYPNWNEKFSPPVIEAALKQDGTLLEFVKYKTKRFALAAIGQYPPAIQWVSFQDEEIATAAVQGDPRTLIFVDKNVLTGALLELAMKLDPEYFRRTEGILTYEQYLKEIN